MALVLDQETATAGDAVFANGLSEDRLDKECAVFRNDADFRLCIKRAERNGIAVAVVNDGVVLSDRPANIWVKIEIRCN